MTRRVLVLDGGRTATPVAAVRALRSAGWTVGVGAPVGSPARRSRAVALAHDLPDAAEGGARFLDELQSLLRRVTYDVVLPSSDAELLALSAGRDALPAHVPLPSHDVVLRALDKLELTRAARAVGLRTPRSVLADDVPEDDPGTWAVKPRLHGERPSGGTTAPTSTRRVTGGRAVRELAGRIAADGGSALAQEVVDGDLIAHVTVLDPLGRPLAAVQQRAITVHPRGAGSSARAATVTVDPVLAEACVALLAELGWTGLAQLQLLAPPAGPPALIDLNGRLYGSLALALAAGVNLPALWADAALSAPAASTPPVRTASQGVRYSASGRDLRQALLARRPTVTEVADVLRAAPGAAHPLWSPRDPGPWLSWSATVAGGWAGRARLSRRAAAGGRPATS